MPHPRVANLPALLGSLLDRGIEFIVVGGASATLHGAAAITQDLDIVHRMSGDSVDRLLGLLGELDAYVREPGNRRIRPDASHLTGGGQLNLLTSLGPLDLLGRLHDGRDYDDLLPHTEVLEAAGHRFRVVDLPTLIEIKTRAGRAKDRIVLPMLLALLRDKGKQQ